MQTVIELLEENQCDEKNLQAKLHDVYRVWNEEALAIIMASKLPQQSLYCSNVTVYRMHLL